MKKILGLLAILLLIVTFTVPTYSYKLSNADYEIIDNLDSRIINLIDSKKSVTPEKVIVLFENYLETKKSSERFEKIVRTVIDDLQYSYYLGEYANSDISADDCYEDEFFDEVEGSCYLLDQDSGNGNDEDYITTDNDSQKSEASSEEENILASYEIAGNEIKLSSGKSTLQHEEIWELFSSIIPKEYRQDFKKYSVFNDPNSDTDAHVIQDEDDIKKWNITINLVGFYNENGELEKNKSIETLIHEFAHVLTLSKTQVKYVPYYASDEFYQKAQENCKAYYVGEGCLSETSYFNAFIESFWKSDFDASQDQEPDDFYSNNQENYVTEYAATNPGEDIAESFAYFVLQSKTSDTTLAEEKMLFFYKYPELVKLRNFIRMRIK